MSSILFGVNRGITNNSHISEDEIYDTIFEVDLGKSLKEVMN